ncbi:MAG: winged helix-turn-helix transcriptional regulator [Gemmatimonadaceae bacterium]|nr:winged helix-turn-helix transcriptional regulator [Gemmatimonadaceae bacterium]
MVYSAQSLDATFSALADPTRREILTRLGRGERTIGELASRFDMSLPAVSKHVRVLQRAGLATVERQGRVRRARITPEPMRSALEWIALYRHFWESELEQLARYLEDASHPDGTSPPTPEAPWPRTADPKSKTSRRSRSAAPSAHGSSASSTRGRRPKS